ncbi:MAG: LysE family translocator [Pseudomonadota bacterium]
MLSIDLLISFAIATVIFAVMPGPALLFTAAQTMAKGRRGGFCAVVGIHLGGLVHVVAAAAGLSAVFQLLPGLYLAVKILGALYLVWLGISIIRQKVVTGSVSEADVADARTKDLSRTFWQSVTVEVLNPKTALFFLAFLPQFVDPGAGWPIWLQFLVLGQLVNMTFSAADGIVVLFTSAVLKRLRQSAKAQKIVRWMGGSILIGLGAHLAIARS